MSNATIDIRDTAGGLIATVLITKDAERVEELMTADYAQLSWQSDSGTPLPAGAYIIFEGEKLSLLDPYEPEQKDELEYTYKPQFQSRVMGWGKVPFFHYAYGEGNVITAREPDWTLTDTPVNFMRAIVAAIKNETEEIWTYEVAEGLPASVTLSFNASDILSGLNAIAGEFDTEWRADKANNVLILGKAQHSHTVEPAIDEDGNPKLTEDGDPVLNPVPVTLQVDSNIGVPSVTKSKEGYYNRFYVYGSTRNITQDYQGANVNNLVNKRLTLNPAATPDGYIDIDRPSGTPIYPKILIFDDIYPHSGLTLANLRPRLMYRLGEDQKKVQVGTDASGNPVYDMYSIWYFQLPGFTLNNSTYSKDNPDGMLISGKNLSVHFKSGALQGREFELIYHPKAETLRNSDGQDFEVLAGDYEIKFIEESGLIIPMQTGIVPADGDEVILFNLRMPQEYTATAYAELEQAALKEIEERYSADLNNYTVNSNPVVFAEADPNLSIGQLVEFVNGGYSYTTRVIKLARKMDFTCEQEITIGNDKIKGNNATLKEEVVNANSNISILTQLNQLTQNVTQAYQRTQQLMLDGFTKIGNMWRFHSTDPSTIITDYNVISAGEIVNHGKDSIGGGIGGTSGVGGSGWLGAVSLGTLAVGDALVWDGTKWTNGTIAATGGINEAELASYLTQNNYITSDYVNNKFVTIGTEETITGKKTFAFNETVFTKKIRIDGDSTGFGVLPTLLFHIPNLEWAKFVFATDGSLNLVSGAATDWSWGNYKDLNTGYHTIITGTGTVKIGSQNSGYVHYESSGPKHWFNKGVCTSGDYYAQDTGGNGQLVWHAGNDGHGSGLDADLLDGLHLGDIRANGYAMQATTIDASGLDQNTWYPVVMWLGCDKNYHFEVFEYLSGRSHPTWGTHGKGFSVHVRWSAIGAGWGTTPLVRQIYESVAAWCETFPVRGIGQMQNSSCEYVYVRGGGVYTFRTSHGITPTLATSTVSVAGESIAPTTTMPAAIVRNVAYTSDNVASATKLQTARNIYGISFNGENDVVGVFQLDGMNNSCLSIYDGGTFRAVQTWNLRPLVLNPQGNNVGIYTTSPRYKLDVNGDIIADGWIRTTGDRGWYNETYGGGWFMQDAVWIRAFNGKSIYTSAHMQADGNILAGGEITNHSDRRLKSDIAPIVPSGRLSPVTYFKDGRRQVGLIAQDVQALLPDAVRVGSDPLGLLSLNYNAALCYGFAEVYYELDNHEERIKQLEAKLAIKISRHG